MIAGISAVGALTAAHQIPLNDVNAPVVLTTGRRIRDEGWPDLGEGARAVVMLDGECSFQRLEASDFDIYWGAYLGADKQMLISGPLADVSAQIIEARAKAREAHGWIMDSYLLARRAN